MYLAIGGVPHYLKQAQRGRSATQIIGELCFGRDGLLRDEFTTLFQSLFSEPHTHLAIVRALAAHGSGLSQDQLAAHAGLSSGGRLKQYLRELETSGFIAAFTPFGRRKKETLYRLVDEFSSFYLSWIDGAPSTALRGDGVGYWHTKARSPAFSAWVGYAFERLCFITVCEMKYTDKPFVIDRACARELGEKLTVFESVTKTKKAVQLVLVSAAGLKPNHYSEDLVADTVDLDAFLA